MAEKPAKDNKTSIEDEIHKYLCSVVEKRKKIPKLLMEREEKAAKALFNALVHAKVELERDDDLERTRLAVLRVEKEIVELRNPVHVELPAIIAEVDVKKSNMAEIEQYLAARRTWKGN